MKSALILRSFRAGQVPEPPDLRVFDGEKVPVALEIGAGAGWHAIEFAKAHPTWKLVAIERTRKKFLSLERRVQHHHECANVIALHGCAIAWTVHAFAKSSLEKVFLLYPNLEIKNRQRRWFQMPFMSVLCERLKPLGIIELRSNNLAYISESKELAQSLWGLEIVEDQKLSKGWRAQTHFEKKYLERGEICYRVVFRKPVITSLVAT